MVRGVVNEHLEAVIRLTVRGPEGIAREIEAVVDTGYDGSLTLPAKRIAALGLAWQRRGRAPLADGSESIFEIYNAEVCWDGEEKPVTVDAAETTPLVGMRLLRGYTLQVEVVEGGAVMIAKRDV